MISGEKEVTTQEFDAVRLKLFNFHSIRSAIVTKLKHKSSQRTDTYKYKMDTDSDGNLMTIRMYISSHTNINRQKKSI